MGETAARAIQEGKLPPFLVVAVDSPGPYRSLNLLPYKPGSGLGGFRGDWCALFSLFSPVPRGYSPRFVDLCKGLCRPHKQKTSREAGKWLLREDWCVSSVPWGDSSSVLDLCGKHQANRKISICLFICSVSLQEIAARSGPRVMVVSQCLARVTCGSPRLGVDCGVTPE